LPLVGPTPEGHFTRRDLIRLHDGRVARALASGRYSTHELLALEERFINRALNERAVGAGIVEPGTVHQALAARPAIGADRAEMVRRLWVSGDRVEVVVGPAGSGKTFVLERLLLGYCGDLSEVAEAFDEGARPHTAGSAFRLGATLPWAANAVRCW
jgi:hypothetical protein